MPIFLKVKVIDYSKKLDYLNSYNTSAKLKKIKNSYFLFIKKNAHIEEFKINIFDRFRKRITSFITSIFKKNLTDEAYRFLSSVFLGRRELLTKKEKFIFINSGTIHLLAISGLHIGIWSLILLFSLKLFNIKFKARLVISLIFLFIYTFLIGAPYSAIRALIIYIIFCISFLFKRKILPLNSLGLAGLFILLICPFSVFDIGFCLSFICVFSLIIFSYLFNFSSFNLFINIILSSFFINLFINPILSFYFGRIYILNIFYNAILIPLFSLILTINFLLIIFPIKILSIPIGSVLSILVYFFNRISEAFSNLRFSFINYRISLPLLILYYLFLVFLLIGIYLKKLTKGNTSDIVL